MNLLNKNKINLKIKSKTIQHKKNGFTVIELMVAAGLGIFLLGAMTKIFISNKQVVVSQNNVAKIQDDSKFAISKLVTHVSQAGYRGCVSGTVTVAQGTKFINATPSSDYGNSTQSIQGYQGTGSSFSPSLDPYFSTVSPAPNSNMDILTVRGADPNSAILLTSTHQPTESLQVSSTTGFGSKANGLITNCTTSSLFQSQSNSVSSTHVITPNGSLVTTYPAGSQVYNYNTITYYVGTDNILYQVYFGQTSQPLAYNVEKFSVMYGLATNPNTTDVTQYVFAPAVTDWTKVVAVRIGMVIKTNDLFTIGTVSSKYSYWFNGKQYTPNDTKLRKIYYTTIALRNMLP